MSNRQSKAVGMTFEPAIVREARAFRELMLLFGVIYPAAVIGIELAWGLCSRTFFDPMPTYWHAAVIAFVPASNLLIWTHLQFGKSWNVKWLAFANGGAIAIAGFYTLLFLPLLPMAIIGILFVIGLLPLAPLVSFVCA